MTEITQADWDAGDKLALNVELDWLGGGGYFASVTAQAFARHRMEERAAIVAWLRKDDFLMTADAIEAGGHLK